METGHSLYYNYSSFLRKKYGEKVYKLPVNLPVTCPNRKNGRTGCSFCAGCGTGFEAADSSVPVKEQLEKTKALVEKKYNARKFIAYFQNYTNTFLPVEKFHAYTEEAARVPGVVEVAVSTRPDCVAAEYLNVLKNLETNYPLKISVELGLQTVNYHTLNAIGRGHTLAEFIDAVLKVHSFGFEVCAHVILNLPGDNLEDSIETARFLSALHIDAVKIHSLYIAKGTRLCDAYENGTISVCSKEEYFERLISFLDYLDPDMAVQRLFSRIPEKDALFCNWGSSWWKLKDELEARMQRGGHYQGRLFHYLDGAALNLL